MNFLMRESIKRWSEFGKEPDPYPLIKSGDLEAALSAFAIREMLDYRMNGRYHSDGWICGFGAVLWMMKDRIGAARVWCKATDEAWAGKLHYSGSGLFESGLLLWFASAWLKDEDWRDEAALLFDKLLHRKRPVGGAAFPSLLARLLLKQIELGEVLAACKDESSEKEALFYGGVRAYEAGDYATTRKLWMQAKAPTYTSWKIEYYLMTHELELLPPQ